MRQIMDENDMNRAYVRLAHELIEKNRGVQDVILIGIQRRGVPMAEHIAQLVEQYEGIRPPVGKLDITFYRDDLSLLSQHPVVSGTDMPFVIEDKRIVIVDDVIYTGRTVRAAIEAIMDVGRPQCIQLMVMVDRGHRELPIRPDFVGKNVPTSHSEVVHVCVDRFDGCNMVSISDRKDVK